MSDVENYLRPCPVCGMRASNAIHDNEKCVGEIERLRDHTMVLRDHNVRIIKDYEARLARWERHAVNAEKLLRDWCNGFMPLKDSEELIAKILADQSLDTVLRREDAP